MEHRETSAEFCPPSQKATQSDGVNADGGSRVALARWGASRDATRILTTPCRVALLVMFMADPAVSGLRPNSVSSFFRKSKIWINSHQTGLAVMALGAALTGVGVLGSLLLSARDQHGVEIVRNEVEQPNFSLSPTPLPAVVVDVAGAVQRSGVYQLENGARLSDALTAAGGLSVDADRIWVSRSLNLAERLTDGAKIFIPSRGESASAGLRNSNSGTVGSMSDASLRVSINTSGLSELDTLWGVGEVRAQAIIDGRPYGSIEELVVKKILPSSVVEKNRDKLGL